jgi:hypothetical protein
MASIQCESVIDIHGRELMVPEITYRKRFKQGIAPEDSNLRCIETINKLVVLTKTEFYTIIDATKQYRTTRNTYWKDRQGKYTRNRQRSRDFYSCYNADRSAQPKSKD